MPRLITVQIGLGTITVTPDVFSDANPAWRPKQGQSISDNKPAGLVDVAADDYDTLGDRNLATIFNRVDNLSGGPYCVNFSSGGYYWYTLKNYNTSWTSDGANGAPNWLGFANGKRKVLAIQGADFDYTATDIPTKFVTDPNMVSSTAGARTFALGATSATGPLPIGTLYLSNTSSTQPLFVAGISFDGTLQEPFGSLTVGAQAAVDRNASVPTPLPHHGLSLVRAQPGSRMQNVRCRAYGYALNSAPPYEKPCIDSNYSQMVTRGIEVDGRVASYIDSTRPRASGGWLLNKEIDLSLTDVHVHHTRRSGVGYNTNTKDTGEVIRFNNVQMHDIANDTPAGDPWPIEVTNPMGFNAPNVEGLIGLLDITNMYSSSAHSHVAWAIPFSSSGVQYVLPNRVVIRVIGFRTNDTIYGGCLRISTSKQPNSTGLSPIWSAMSADFAGATAKYFEVREYVGGPLLTAVKASQFNPAIHNSSSNWVATTF